MTLRYALSRTCETQDTQPRNSFHSHRDRGRANKYGGGSVCCSLYGRNMIMDDHTKFNNRSQITKREMEKRVRVVVHEDQACQGRCLSRPRPAAPPAACCTFIDPGPGPRVYPRRDEPSPSITTLSLGITKHTKNTAPDMADGNCICCRYGRVDGVQVKHTQALPSNGTLENTVMRTVCLDSLHPLRIWLFSQIMRKTITRVQHVRGLAGFGKMSN